MGMIILFEDYLRLEKSYSELTIQAYSRDLLNFENFINRTYSSSLLNANSSEVRSWIYQLVESNYNHNSVNRKLSVLKSFYKFLVLRNHRSDNPTSLISSLKKSKRLPEFIAEDKMMKFLVSSDLNDYEAFLQDTIILLFYQTGIRVSELRNLKIRAIDFNKKEVKVFGKRSKERLVPFGNELAARLKDFQFIKSTMEVPASEFLFTNIKGAQLSPSYIYNKVKSRLSDFTEQKKRSPHVLRHTFATQMLNSGANLNAIKEILGHSSLAATQVYTHNTFGKLKNIHKSAHPRA